MLWILLEHEAVEKTHQGRLGELINRYYVLVDISDPQRKEGILELAMSIRRFPPHIYSG